MVPSSPDDDGIAVEGVFLHFAVFVLIDHRIGGDDLVPGLQRCAAPHGKSLLVVAAGKAHDRPVGLRALADDQQIAFLAVATSDTPSASPAR